MRKVVKSQSYGESGSKGEIEITRRVDMKLKFNFKNKEASLEADVEGLVEKGIERKNNPNRKTRYQIRQEEKRKDAELKHKQEMQVLYIIGGVLAVLFIIIFVMAALEG